MISAIKGCRSSPQRVARDQSDALRSGYGMVLDKALRRRNYNPYGAYSSERDTTLRSRIDYTMGGGWSVAHVFTWYDGERDFVLSGDQNFTVPPPLSQMAALPARS